VTCARDSKLGTHFEVGSKNSFWFNLNFNLYLMVLEIGCLANTCFETWNFVHTLGGSIVAFLGIFFRLLYVLNNLTLNWTFTYRGLLFTYRGLLFLINMYCSNRVTSRSQHPLSEQQMEERTGEEPITSSGCGEEHLQVCQEQPGHHQHLHQGLVLQEVQEKWEDEQNWLHCQFWGTSGYNFL